MIKITKWLDQSLLMVCPPRTLRKDIIILIHYSIVRLLIPWNSFCFLQQLEPWKGSRSLLYVPEVSENLERPRNPVTISASAVRS